MMCCFTCLLTSPGASAHSAAQPVVCPGGEAPGKGRVVEVTHKVVVGETQQVEALLMASTTSTTIHTSLVERDHLSWREHHRRLTRKTIAFSKELQWLKKHL